MGVDFDELGEGGTGAHGENVSEPSREPTKSATCVIEACCVTSSTRSWVFFWRRTDKVVGVSKLSLALIKLGLDNTSDRAIFVERECSSNTK